MHALGAELREHRPSTGRCADRERAVLGEGEVGGLPNVRLGSDAVAVRNARPEALGRDAVVPRGSQPAGRRLLVPVLDQHHRVVDLGSRVQGLLLHAGLDCGRLVDHHELAQHVVLEEDLVDDGRRLGGRDQGGGVGVLRVDRGRGGGEGCRDGHGDCHAEDCEEFLFHVGMLL